VKNAVMTARYVITNMCKIIVEICRYACDKKLISTGQMIKKFYIFCS
jgi:hypothetical protein